MLKCADISRSDCFLRCTFCFVFVGTVYTTSVLIRISYERSMSILLYPLGALGTVKPLVKSSWNRSRDHGLHLARN